MHVQQNPFAVNNFIELSKWFKQVSSVRLPPKWPPPPSSFFLAWICFDWEMGLSCVPSRGSQFTAWFSETQFRSPNVLNHAILSRIHQNILDRKLRPSCFLCKALKVNGLFKPKVDRKIFLWYDWSMVTQATCSESEYAHVFLSLDRWNILSSLHIRIPSKYLNAVCS